MRVLVAFESIGDGKYRCLVCEAVVSLGQVIRKEHKCSGFTVESGPLEIVRNASGATLPETAEPHGPAKTQE